MTLSIDHTYVIEVLKRLVQIDSTNPSLDPANAGEAEITAFIAKKLDELGLATTVYDLAPGRKNVIGVLRGRGNGRSLLLNGHMDTVGVKGMDKPFGVEIRDGKLYGRGAQDMKASLAAMLGVAKALIDSETTLDGDLILTFVADEEVVSIGMVDLIKRLAEDGTAVDGAIVLEPTDLAVCRAHRGFVWYDVHSIGRAAHGSRFREGIDANMRMGRFLAKLDILEQELLKRPPHPLAGPPSLHAAKIQGGSEISIYAAECLLQIERRTIPGETVNQTTAELQTLADELAAQDPTFKLTIEATFDRDPFTIDAEAAIVQTLDRAVTKCLGKSTPHIGQTFWTDAALLAAAGIETVLIGPTGAGLHSVEEWVDIQSVVDLTAILTETAVAFSSSTPKKLFDK